MQDRQFIFFESMCDLNGDLNLSYLPTLKYIISDNERN